ncbi:MAG: tRNA guanosine(34) transglycosylase Tgt [Myxococcales bacterium]|nr:tRNA guanosine(34) transglycosylase Tgt [Myxococcales bacterium]
MSTINGSEPISFEILKSSGTTAARLGKLVTAHSVVDTPVFMPVGTLACVKALTPKDLEELGAKIILNNAYHLMLRPGDEEVKKYGGLQKFMAYGGSILTDSGGFQVFSLEGLRKINDEGVTFQSHLDGSYHTLTPESLVKVQENLGSDIAMVLDECPSGGAQRDVVAKAMERTTAWAKRCVAARSRPESAWFGIVQGGTYEDLRREHAETISELPFHGYAIGGVSVGESPEDIARIVRHTAPLLPEGRPRYLMGVGTPADLVRGVAAGVDMFDCVMPTRNARNGQLFTREGKINIKNARHKEEQIPLDEGCGCYTCTTFTRAYLRHLFVNRELTFYRLASIHNLNFYLELMADIRAALMNDSFDENQFLIRAGAS